MALAPIEWFRLVATHGRGEYWLWPDFYSDDGEALQPATEVPWGHDKRIPTFRRLKNDLDSLLDYTFVQLQLDRPFRRIEQSRRALLRFGASAVREALDMRVGSPPNRLADRLRWDVLVELNLVDPSALRDRWNSHRLDSVAAAYALPLLAKQSVPIAGCARTIELVVGALDRVDWPRAWTDAPDVYFGIPGSLQFHLQDCMPDELLLPFVLGLLNRLPEDRLPAQVLHALTGFRNERVLDWIERHAVEPIGYQWGAAAAVNRLSWDRICRWLDHGAPLSLIALDAMKNCRGFDPTDKNMSGIFRNVSPTIAGVPDSDDVRQRLVDYALRNPSPRVADTVEVFSHT